MKFEHYQKKLNASKSYKNFKKKYPEAYLCAGFFVFDYENGKDMHQIDYMLKNKKIVTFALDKEVKMHISEMAMPKKLPEIKGGIKTDLEALKGIVQDEMKNRTITDNIKKMIAVLQVIDDKKIWNLNCITSNLNVLQIHIDDEDQTILKFIKYSITDIMKIMPQKQAMPQQMKEPSNSEENEKIKIIKSPEEFKKIKEELKALEKEAKEQEKSKEKQKEKKKTKKKVKKKKKK